MDLSDRCKIAFMIDSKEGKISKISFCFDFLETENLFMFNYVGEILNKDVMMGYTYEEANENFEKNPAYDHFKFESDSQYLNLKDGVVISVETFRIGRKKI